ncbi:MAG: hypothetical protein ACQBVK_05545, partial [Candidatus Phytoplasma sp. TWB_XP]
MNHMQQSRLKKLKNNKLAFICSEIRDLNKNFSNIDFQFDDVDIEDNFDYFYKLSNINYEKRTSEEIIKNIKEKIKETEELKNYDLGEEYYLYLQKNPQKLKKFYKQICEILTMNKDKFIS